MSDSVGRVHARNHRCSYALALSTGAHWLMPSLCEHRFAATFMLSITHSPNVRVLANARVVRTVEESFVYATTRVNFQANTS